MGLCPSPTASSAKPPPSIVFISSCDSQDSTGMAVSKPCALGPSPLVLFCLPPACILWLPPSSVLELRSGMGGIQLPGTQLCRANSETSVDLRPMFMELPGVVQAGPVQGCLQTRKKGLSLEWVLEFRLLHVYTGPAPSSQPCPANLLYVAAWLASLRRRSR